MFPIPVDKILELYKNKYKAINIGALFARQLKDKQLQQLQTKDKQLQTDDKQLQLKGDQQKESSVSLIRKVLLELSEGRIRYKE